MPSGLDLEALVQAHGLADEWGTRKREEKMAFIIHYVLTLPCYNNRDGEKGGYVPLNAKRLESLLGPRYATQALKTLVSMGVLERLPQYSAGRFARPYRLSPAYRGQLLRTHVIHDAVLARKLRATDDTKTAEAIAGHSSRAFVFANLAAVAVMRAGQGCVASRSYQNQAEQAAWLLSLRVLSEGQHWLRTDKATGRVFHPLTQCPRELRRFLTIDGERAAEVDMANAQPFFLLSLYPEDCPERSRFAASVGRGLFYDDLFLAMDWPDRKPWGFELKAWKGRSSDDRDRFKKHVMLCVLYSQFRPDKSSHVFRAFSRLYPWLARELAFRRAEKAGASALAAGMQKHEADLILGRVIPRIQAELPGCRAVTIHDGIFCQRRFAWPVACIVEAEALAVFGVRPRARVKPHKSAC